MDAFCLRLLSFFDKGADGGPGKWPLVSPTAEDMAGAGFTHAPAGNQMDNVKCEACGLECFKWEATDNPYADHENNQPLCPFIQEEIFAQFRETFESKAEARNGTPPISPGADGAAPATPRTPARRPRRAKSVLSPVRIVADVEPQAVQSSPSTPLRIQIHGSGVSMNLEVNGSGVTPSSSKKRRME